MYYLKKSLKMLKFNLKTLLGFEALFKLLSIFLFTPLFLKLFDFIMKISGFSYLTLENIFDFLINPLTIILLIILILLMMVYTMFDITTIVIILDYSYHLEKISIIKSVKLSLKKCLKMFHLKNIYLAIFILFLIPFFNIGIGSSFIKNIHIPEYIMNFIIKNTFLVLIFIIVFIFLLTIFFKAIYAIHYYVLENISFKEALKKSSILGKNKHIKDFITILIVQLIFFIIYLIFIALGIYLIYLFNHLTNLLIKSFLTTVISLFLLVSFLIYANLSTPISYSVISTLYYLKKERKNEKISFNIKKRDNENLKISKKILASIVIIIVFLGTYFCIGYYKGDYNLSILNDKKIEVTAHRGSSNKYPENTFLAFNKAKELESDFIELDVQQTKDLEIVVIHDKNLKRTTGVNKDVNSLNLEDILSLDAGSFMSSEFKDEKIPILKDVIKWAKENNIKLNIELKPTGKETLFEQSVIDIIKYYNYEENSYIASQVYSVLENVKKIDSNMKTIYVMSIFYGDVDDFIYADYFSLEASNINERIVKNIHKNNKKVLAWTINSSENIKTMLDLNVDNIITDDVLLAKKTINEYQNYNLIFKYIKWLEKVF